jgi:hypothetical protein
VGSCFNIGARGSLARASALLPCQGAQP